VAYLEAIEPDDDGRRRFRLRAPRDGRDLGILRVDRAEDVAAAIARARAAQPAWAELGVRARADIIKGAVAILLRRRSEFMEVINTETGRTRMETVFMSMFASCDFMNFYARRAHKVLADRAIGAHLLKMKRIQMIYQPLGVVGVITPWNGPFEMSLNVSVQALLAGNAVVLKPSEATPRSGGLTAELLHEAGVPPDVFQVVYGDGETGAALVDGGVDKISFTGSVRTGRKVGEACGRNLVPCTLELGGKDPMIICEDANLERASAGAVFGAYMNAGQYCSSTERIYVERGIADVFLDKVLARVSALELGRDIGAIIFEPQFSVIEGHLADAVEKGARILMGGAREGNFFQPTVIVDVDHTMKLMTEETFGPILAVQVVDDLDEAIALANDTDYGLGASIFTRDKAKADAIARRLRSGSVCVNDAAVTYGVLEVPFGGRGQSGVGQINGAEALRQYCQPVPVIHDRFQRDEEHIWHPFTEDKIDGMLKAVGAIWGSPLRWWM
jgi:acyl-CoA reductase-like NAD-dependent aldehyde dehydrogenase